MSNYEQKEYTGTLFKNDKQGNEKRPDYRGKINVNGQEFELSAWIKEGKKGKFMSLSVQEPRQQESAPSPRGGGHYGDEDENIPF